MDELPAEDSPNDPRVYLAFERTLLAWVRTGLAMMGFGFIVARFGLFLREAAQLQSKTPPRHTSASVWIGIILVAIGSVAMVMASRDYIRAVQRVKRGEPVATAGSTLVIAVTSALVLLGIAMVLYLMFYSWI